MELLFLIIIIYICIIYFQYCCYIKDCKETFWKPEERMTHCIQIHKIPKDFRFESTPKSRERCKNKDSHKMDIETQGDSKTTSPKEVKTSNTQFKFRNCKQKVFANFAGKNIAKGTENINIDQVMTDLKESLPPS